MRSRVVANVDGITLGRFILHNADPTGSTLVTNKWKGNLPNGLRFSEALGADVDDPTTERGHRVLKIKRKVGKTATVPLAPRTAEAVDVYLGDRTTGPLFETASGARAGIGPRPGAHSGVWPRKPCRQRQRASIPTTSGTPL